MNPRTRLSPLLELCCLRLSANESYQNAEAEIEALTGVKVSHSTQQRRVIRQEMPTPEAKQAVGEVSIDGGKVRLRGQPGEGGYWRDVHCSEIRRSLLWCFLPKQSIRKLIWLMLNRCVNHLCVWEMDTTACGI